MRRSLSIVLAAVLLAGCGEQRTSPPDVEHADAPKGTYLVSIESAGVTFQGPENWVRLGQDPPFEGGLASKTAAVAIWRYPRTEPLPGNERAMERTRTRLLDQLRDRNPTFALLSSTLTERGGAKGIELTGRQTIGGMRYDVRSAHLFKHGGEVVIDAYAPPVDFKRLDETVFTPLLESLTVDVPE